MTPQVDVDIDAIERRAEDLVLAHENLMRDLIRMRAKHNLTQAEVAERMGVSQPTVAAFERYDANPTLSTIRRYALAVEARLDEKVVDDCCAGHRSRERFVEALPQVLPHRFTAARPTFEWDTDWTGSEARVRTLIAHR